MCKIVLPLESLLRDILPTRTERFLNRLRFESRINLPQKLGSLAKYGMPDAVHDRLERAYAKVDMPESVFTMIVVDELFLAAQLSYVARENNKAYLDRKLAASEVYAARRLIHEALGVGFSRTLRDSASNSAPFGNEPLQAA